MTFIVKHRGDTTRPLLCTYTCPEHGEFDAEVERDADGNAPDVIPCPEPVGWSGVADRPAGTFGPDDPGAPGVPIGIDECALISTWTPSPIGCRVRRVEVVRGGWEKPERPTYLNTQKLGEGQDPAEFRAERKKVWAEERRKQVKELLR